MNLSQLIMEPTRVNLKDPSRSTLIDLILTNNPHKYPHSGVFAMDLSDHSPIVCVRNTKLIKTKP